MTLRVRVVVPARDEEARIGRLLTSVNAGFAHARRAGAAWQGETLVVLDRCRDRTRERALAAGAHVISCPFPFGKVEALRAGLCERVDVHVCVDADVVLGRRTLLDLVEALLRDGALLAACPPLTPEPLQGLSTPLAWALHRYNAARGFSSERLWLSGRCYALRHVAFPTAAEIAQRAARVAPKQRFPGLAAPLSADDVWLSRALLAQGAACIRHIDTDAVAYRAPSTLRGMSRVYRRLRRELRRIDLLFPELKGPGRDRRIDQLDGVRDRAALALFHAALWLCRAHAALEEWAAAAWGREPDVWPVVLESKR